jgi:hypothetical protein
VQGAPSLQYDDGPSPIDEKCRMGPDCHAKRWPIAFFDMLRANPYGRDPGPLPQAPVDACLDVVCADPEKCVDGKCTCGGVTPCGKEANACVEGVCKCGDEEACSGLTDTCADGVCGCGANGPCNPNSTSGSPVTGDRCSDGQCVCGDPGIVCQPGEYCPGGTCFDTKS